MVDGLSVEFSTVLVAAVIGTYTFIGGLGATFYVSYFNTALIYVIMLIVIQKVYNDSSDTTSPLGNIIFILSVQVNITFITNPLGNT